MKAAAVIVCYRTPELCERAVITADAALRDDEPIIVVDTSEDGSLDSSHVFANREVLLMHPGNVGYAEGLNMGIAETDADLLILSNADIEYPARVRFEHLRALMTHTPEIGLLGPRQITPEGRIAHAGMRALGDTSGGRYFGQTDTGQGLEFFERMEQVSGSVMLLRRKALNDIGGKIPSPGRLYFEDAALCRALAEKRWFVAYSGVATFLHHVAASPAPPNTSRAQMAAESRRAFEA